MIHDRSRGALLTDVSPGALLLPPVAATAFLWLTTPNPVEIVAVAYAFLLLLMPWGSYLCWRAGNRAELPLFSMVAAAYWVYFALALFWGTRSFSTALAAAGIVPTEASITATTWMALIGVIFVWVGMRIPITIVLPDRLPDIVDRKVNWTYVRVVLLAGVTLALSSGSGMLLGAEGRQLMMTLTSIVPTAAFVLLFNRHLDGAAVRADKVALLIGAVGMVGGSLAAGWLGPVIAWGITCGSLILLKRRRIPAIPVASTIALLLFLQVAKADFRANYWSGADVDAGLIEKVQFWIERSASTWGDALSSNGGEDAIALASRSLQRASLLTQVAHVLEITPDQVPFQHGSTYKYLIITWIPRALWRDKPSVNEANRFYQVAYGLTNEKSLKDVSISVGSLAEGYINFGWAGVIGAMLLIGVVLGVFQRTYVVTHSSAVFMAVGLTLVPTFLSIESQLAVYLGGVVQQATLAIIVFLPVIGRRRDSFAARPLIAPLFQQ